MLFRLVLTLATLAATAGAGAPTPFAELEKKAYDGDAAAAIEIATRYWDGAGTPADWTLAAQWYEKAAILGSGEGAYRHARACLRGEGVPVDPERANLFLRKARLAGFPIPADEMLEPERLDLFPEEAELEVTRLIDRKKWNQAMQLAFRYRFWVDRLRGSGADLIPACLLLGKTARHRPSTQPVAEQALKEAIQIGEQALAPLRGTAATSGKDFAMDVKRYAQNRQATETLLNWRTARFELARLYAAAGRKEDAITQFEAILEAEDSAEAVSELAWLYAAAGHAEQAATMVERDRATRSDISRKLLKLAQELESTGDIRTATSYRQKAADVVEGKPITELKLDGKIY